MPNLPPIEDLYLAAREVIELLPRLAEVIPDQDTVLESQIGSHRKQLAPPIPWNTSAAMLYYEIHGDARRYESLLTLRLFHRSTYRPGSDDHTVECVSRLPVLIAHGRDAGLDLDLDLRDPTAALLRWPRSVRVMLGEARAGDEPRVPVPGGARCPHCSGRLMLSDGWRALEANASAQCLACRDERGRPLSWPVTERIGVLQHDELVTEEDARHRYGLSSSRLRVWKHRGRIHPYGEDPTGRRMYRVRDVLALLDEARDAPTG